MIAALLLLSPSDLQVDLSQILRSTALKGAAVGVRVERIDGAPLFSKDADVRLVPASNEKLLAAAYALYTLGPDYRPSTKFWKLDDRVVVDSPGDPMMTHAQLEGIKKNLGIEKKLPVYVRQAYNPGIAPGWEWDDLPNKYAAPVSAFTVDRGSFELWAENGKLFFVPESYGAQTRQLRIRGQLKWRYWPDSMYLFVWGEIPEKKKRIDTLALGNPWKCAGSVLGGPVLPAIALPDQPPTLTFQGSSIATAVRECLVKSDNNIAEHLLLMAAGKESALPDEPYPIAAERLAKFMAQTVGCNPDDVDPADGSGLSRHNLVTAQALCALLRWSWSQPTKDLWLDSLARPSQEGTLKDRLKSSSFRGKTGTLRGASALSGYVRAAGGDTIVVSLIFNNYKSTSSAMRAIQDEFVRRLEKEGAGSRSVCGGRR